MSNTDYKSPHYISTRTVSRRKMKLSTLMFFVEETNWEKLKSSQKMLKFCRKICNCLSTINYADVVKGKYI